MIVLIVFIFCFSRTIRCEFYVGTVVSEDVVEAVVPEGVANIGVSK